jgi:hypothetical protein
VGCPSDEGNPVVHSPCGRKLLEGISRGINHFRR